MDMIFFIIHSRTVTMGNSKVPKMADKSDHTERRETLSGAVGIPDHTTEPRLARMLGKTHEVTGIQGPTRIPEGTVLTTRSSLILYPNIYLVLSVLMAIYIYIFI